MNDIIQNAMDYCDGDGKLILPIIMDLMKGLFNIAMGDDPGDVYADLEKKLPKAIYELLEDISAP
ncbi:MAG: hypothetical protein NC218_08300 [Acetobacter sp.]|nr:hypothetical protein [Acetobacter sp.]